MLVQELNIFARSEPALVVRIRLLAVVDYLHLQEPFLDVFCLVQLAPRYRVYKRVHIFNSLRLVLINSNCVSHDPASAYILR